MEKDQDALIKRLQELAAKGETEKTIELLLNKLSELDSDLYQQILVLSGRFSKLKREQRLGLTPSENENEILHSIVGMIDDLKKKHAGLLDKPAGVLHREVKPSGDQATTTAGITSKKRELTETGSRNRLYFMLGGAAVILLLIVWIATSSGEAEESLADFEHMESPDMVTDGEDLGFSDFLTEVQLGFFAGGDCDSSTPFSEVFSISDAGDITFCLEYSYEDVTEPFSLQRTEKYIFPDGQVFSSTYEETVSPGSYTIYSSGSMLGEFADEPPAGTYEVEVWLDGVLEASGAFRVE